MNIVTFLIGTMLILTGTAVVMNNLGYNNWNLLILARKLWPVVLIVAGLGVLWRGNIPNWLAFILVLVLTGGLITLFLLAPEIYQLQGAKRWFYYLTP